MVLPIERQHRECAVVQELLQPARGVERPMVPVELVLGDPMDRWLACCGEQPGEMLAEGTSALGEESVVVRHRLGC